MKKEAPAVQAKRLNSPRHYRALAQLLKEPSTVRQLWDIAGGTGIPQLVDALRKKGLKIDTIPRTGTDRDNRKCRYGLYTLRPESRQAAEQLLNDYRHQGSAKNDEE